MRSEDQYCRSRVRGISHHHRRGARLGHRMVKFCEDCIKEVEISVSRDWFGDPEVPMGVYEFEVWTCTECGGHDLREKDKDHDRKVLHREDA